MNKAIMGIMAVTAMLFAAGCFTSAKARTIKTAPDGTVTESYVSIIGTGDKASEVAAEGMFADGTTEDLGAGVKNAKASQQSTGIGETMTGLGDLLKGLATLQGALQGIKVPVAAPVTTPAASVAPATAAAPVACEGGTCTWPATKAP